MDACPIASVPLVVMAYEIKIVGGIEAHPNELPYQVAITFDDDFICGGSIISQVLILTAAHCVFSWTPENIHNFQVIAGLHNLTSPAASEQVREVKIIYMHENYNNNTLANDIAILLLNEPLRFSDTIKKVELAGKGESFEGNATISGWGRTKFGGWGSVKLRKASIPIFPADVCRSKYKGSYNITDNMMCIGGTGADACQGDSGGAAVCRRNDTFVQCGIVSFGHGCGRIDYPGVYTRVSEYIDWISKAEKQIL